MKNIALSFLVVFGFILGKYSILPAWSLVSIVQPSLVIILFVTIIMNRRAGFLSAVSVGIIDELFAFRAPHGSFLVSYLSMVWATDYLLNTLFTNRSSYVLFVVTSIGSLFFSVFEYLYTYMAHTLQFTDFLQPASRELFILWLTRALLVPLLVLICFFVLRRLGIIFTTNFLTSGKTIR